MNLQPLNNWINSNIAVVGGAMVTGIAAVSTIGLVAVFNLVGVVSALSNQVDNNIGDIAANIGRIETGSQGQVDHLRSHEQAAQALANELVTFRKELITMVSEANNSVLTIVQLQGLEARLLEVQTGIDREQRITSGDAAAPPTEANWRNLERLQIQKRQLCNDIRALVPARECD